MSDIDGNKVDTCVKLKTFYASRTLYVFTEQLIGISIPIIIYQGTRDATLAAMSFVAIWAPRCLFPIVAAPIIDVRHPETQIRVIDLLRVVTLLLFVILPVGAWLLVGVGLLSLLNLWAIALFEKGLQFASVNHGQGSPPVDSVTKFSAALRADRVALTASALISGSLLSLNSEVLLHVGAAAVLIAAHVLQSRSGILRMEMQPPVQVSILQVTQHVFSNPNLRGLIYLMWVLNLLQGAVFGALPVLIEELFARDAVIAASVFAAFHVLSWGVLRVYPGVAARISVRVRLFVAMALSTLPLALGFATGSFVLFVIGTCVAFSVRNILDVETIIERNRHIEQSAFGQVMTVFLPLVYMPFAVAGVAISVLFHYGGPLLLGPIMVTGALVALAVWALSLRFAFCDRARSGSDVSQMEISK